MWLSRDQLTVVDRLVSWFCPCVKQNADLRIELPTYSIEEPTVRIDLLGIFLLQAEDDLDWHLRGVRRPRGGVER